ncbi:hypothetical protein ALI144C_19630 [Actinosynnema sp. ALI-1.44]|uniref:hypothetical protein n=1 Tax=Actinosynnema sp. ALI-1.44 TaxID=1933779 RepID=UPI00097C01EB|nr:hypothetical protein [Actinosynnema sp. ALI-1.44]ONI81527.1 hypothetical protein ALI144C_19630 [Actinosynnema sp. ALI-1.44]
MAWRWRRRRRKPLPDVPRRNWARLPVLDTTIGGASDLLTHKGIVEPDQPRPVPHHDTGPAGQAGGIVRPHPVLDPEPDQPDGIVGELPESTRSLPVVRQHTEAPLPLIRTSAQTVGAPQQPAEPFHNITEYDRLMAQYENLDAEAIAAAISMSSVAEPPPFAPAPTPVGPNRSLHRPTLAQSRRLGLTAKNRASAARVAQPEVPQEVEEDKDEPGRAALPPGELVYRATPWSAPTSDGAVPFALLAAVTTAPAEAPPPDIPPPPDNFGPSFGSEPAGPLAAQEWRLPGITDLPPIETNAVPIVPDTPHPDTSHADTALRGDIQALRATVQTLTARREPDDLTDPETVSALAGRLYRHIRDRLRTELLIDRERHGTLADHW